MIRSLTLALSVFASGATAQTCGGSWSDFIAAATDRAISMGYSRQSAMAFFNGAQQDQAVLQADRAQGVFQRDFIDFSRRLISSNRIQNAQAQAQQQDAIFDRIEAELGIPRGVMLAFWAFETDFGAFQGDFNTRNALLTLAHDCRRPELFRPHIYSALELFIRGDFDPDRTTGAWAGEIGMVQMLPGDIIENGRDGDGDGHITLKTSAPDALLSGASVLSSLGWVAGQPWLQEVTAPSEMDWSLSGTEVKMSTSDWAGMGVTARNGSLPNLQASLILPMGRKGPAFLAYPNFDVYFEWNQSFVYVLTAAYFGTRLEGAPVYNAGNPDAGLSGEQVQQLQRKLEARGHDVGGADGIIGARTRVAIQAEQQRLGMPADAWPTPALLNAL
ncbi:peptidoglycan-binding protein [Octadecabacter sp. 1_MG-2023]|uniref:lytic murein transglycosylase n=1 Tax=unclassified Octadecabacter TaxID=196158 RepID=UPI001C081F2F|nr:MULTISPECIES: peptidoglycan-binding protein [unclassified Octadecabacter]MBU2992579.1 peptidoglycan-binding protein [Octadecabacter sp. B2R22]MDO6734664.1 peptidoglycan-binding protein [Octadecabacter sp. 1_MG-2023]